jgi:TPR repeat protein
MLNNRWIKTMSRLLQKVFLVCWFAPFLCLADAFEEAQQAATEGRYKDVVELLSISIESGELAPQDEVVAYSNRGVAYSLLQAYGLATQDLKRALSFDENNTLALNHLGLLAGQVDRDYTIARDYFERGALLGFPGSQVNLANLYKSGKGVEQDFSRAFELYTVAVEQNYGMAYVPLGLLYLNGEGVATDTKKAVGLFEDGVEAGVIEAHYYLGQSLEKGIGVSTNVSLATEHYRFAAMQGHNQAQNALGYMYRRGVGVARDYVEAALWYELASQQGNVEAKNRLSWLLAGCPTQKVCNGELAVRLAKEAVAAEDKPGYLDSLASAYARVGEFDLAVTTVQSALDALPNDGRQRACFERRLRSYQQRKPFQL